MRELKTSMRNSLEAALLVATSEENTREAGRATFNEAIINGGSVEDALYATLDQVAADATAWNEGLNKFFSEQKAQESFLQLVALQAALETLTDDIQTISNARVTFIDTTATGSTLEEALALALDAAAEDDESWAIAEQVFYDKLEEMEYPEQENEEEENKPSIAEKIMKVVAITIGVVMIAVLAFVIGTAWLNSREVKEPIAEIPATTEAPAPNRDEAIVKAMNIMTEAGWKPGEFIIDTVDGNADASTTGNGAFTNENIKTPSAMVAFLKSGSDAANALLAKLMKDADATKEEVLNDLNWVAVQSNIPFTYPGNTGFKNGEIIDTGSRTGGSGDIFLLFIAPVSGEFQPVRGACANPQTVVPKPEKPDVPKLQPKSPNPNDYVHPVGKPVVPTVTTPPETAPPVVDQFEKGPSGINDYPTKDPGTESGVTAPGAVPAVPDRSDKVPPAEPKVNPAPSNDGVNVGDPGNPF